jgi:hypothetical protein
VWIISSPTAVLYRIDSRSAAVTGRRDLGERAGRPVVEHGVLFVGLSDGGGSSLTVDAQTLDTASFQPCCDPLGHGYEEVYGHGSSWWMDPRTGTVGRFVYARDAGYSPEATIAVTTPPRYSNGPCITSVTTTSEAVWVTLAYSSNGDCVRE